jgi:hypothetical protein
LSSLHKSGCPNAPEPIAIYTCSCCGEGITLGEKFVEINGEDYHYDCVVHSYTVDEILELVGIDVLEADVY